MLRSIRSLRYQLVALLWALCVIGAAAPGPFEGTYEAQKAGPRADLRLRLTLEPRGRCGLSVESASDPRLNTAWLGTWKARDEGTIACEWANEGRRDRMTFRREAGAVLVATEWDRERYGPTAFRMTVLMGGGPLMGTYAGSCDRFALSLTLAGGGVATLRTETRDRMPRVEILRGRWQTDDLGRLRLRVGEVPDDSAFVFRVSGDRLTAADWERGRWGGVAPELQKVLPEGGSQAALEGAWTSRRAQGAQSTVYILALERDGTATLSVESGPTGFSPRLYRGSWLPDGEDRIRIQCSLGNATADFTFRVEREVLTAVRWDARAWGSIPLVFRKS